jgi:hypothetical protein
MPMRWCDEEKHHRRHTVDYPGRVVLCMNEANKKADIIGTA